MEMNIIFNAFGVKTDDQKDLLSELVCLVVDGNHCLNKNYEDVRKAVWGTRYGSLREKTLRVAGYWSNDLEILLADDLALEGSDRNLFQRLFKLLNNIEIIDGLTLKF